MYFAHSPVWTYILARRVNSVGIKFQILRTRTIFTRRTLTSNKQINALYTNIICTHNNKFMQRIQRPRKDYYTSDTSFEVQSGITKSKGLHVYLCGATCLNSVTWPGITSSIIWISRLPCWTFVLNRCLLYLSWDVILYYSSC